MSDDSITKELISALDSGKADRISSAFELVYNTYIKLVAFIVSKYVSDSEDIKDISNDVFVSFFNNAVSVTGSVKYYLAVCAKNAAINFSVKSSHETPYSDDIFGDVEDDNSLSSVSYRETVADMNKHLSPEEVRIILLHAVYGYSFSEIGKRLGKPEGTVKTLYHRAIKKYSAHKSGNNSNNTF